MPAQNQKPAVTDKLKLMTTSRMKMPRVSFFMLLPPCRGGYGRVGKEKCAAAIWRTCIQPIYRFSLSIYL